MKKILNYIGSRRFAIYLLIVTTSVILMSNLLPKLSIMDAEEVQRLKRDRPILYAITERAGIENLVRTRYFQIIPVFIFLSIGICTVRRVRGELEKSAMRAGRQDDNTISLRLFLPAGSFDREKAAAYLSRKKWGVLMVPGTPDQILADKGHLGIWGSVIFHLGMEIVLAGILVSIIYSNDGIGLFTEGFPVSTPDAMRWSRKGNIEGFPFKEIMVESFKPVFENGFPVAYDSAIVAMDLDNRLRSYKIGVNRYLTIDDYKIIFNRAGYAPKFILKKGDSVSELVTNLKISMPGVIDTFDVPEEGLRFKVEMFPDFYRENGQPKTKTKNPFNPVLFVEIAQDGRMIGRGFLEKGKTVNFDKYTLEFEELKYWVELIASRDAGVAVITLGFILIAIGLSARFVLNERCLWIIINEKGDQVELGMGWKARFFPAMFDEEMRVLAEGVRLEFEENRA